MVREQFKRLPIDLFLPASPAAEHWHCYGCPYHSEIALRSSIQHVSCMKFVMEAYSMESIVTLTVGYEDACVVGHRVT